MLCWFVPGVVDGWVSSMMILRASRSVNCTLLAVSARRAACASNELTKCSKAAADPGMAGRHHYRDEGRRDYELGHNRGVELCADGAVILIRCKPLRFPHWQLSGCDGEIRDGG